MTGQDKYGKVPKKTNIGCLVDSQVYQDFRIQCFKNNLSPGDTLTTLMKQYLKILLSGGLNNDRTR